MESNNNFIDILWKNDIIIQKKKIELKFDKNGILKIENDDRYINSKDLFVEFTLTEKQVKELEN